MRARWPFASRGTKKLWPAILMWAWPLSSAISIQHPADLHTAETTPSVHTVWFANFSGSLTSDVSDVGAFSVMAAPNCFFSSGFRADADADLGCAGSALGVGSGALAHAVRREVTRTEEANQRAARITGRVWPNLAKETRPYRSRSRSIRGKKMPRCGSAWRCGGRFWLCPRF